MAKYNAVHNADDDIYDIGFRDYMDRVMFMEPQEKAKSLYYALFTKNYRKINAHAALFQIAPHNMSLVVSPDESTRDGR